MTNGALIDKKKNDELLHVIYYTLRTIVKEINNISLAKNKDNFQSETFIHKMNYTLQKLDELIGETYIEPDKDRIDHLERRIKNLSLAVALLNEQQSEHLYKKGNKQ